MSLNDPEWAFFMSRLKPWMLLNVLASCASALLARNIRYDADFGEIGHVFRKVFGQPFRA
jgi:hypothetical protein